MALLGHWRIFGTFSAQCLLDLASNRRYQFITSMLEFISLKIWEKVSAFFDGKFAKMQDKLKSKRDKKVTNEKRDPNLVHHDELKRSSRKKKSDDDDKFDVQKFAEISLEPNTKEIAEMQNKNFVEGVRLGIGLAFLSMAINGFADDLLFNIQSSMLMWQLGALAAACYSIKN